MAWYGMARCGVVWCGLVWSGMVCMYYRYPSFYYYFLDIYRSTLCLPLPSWLLKVCMSLLGYLPAGKETIEGVPYHVILTYPISSLND